MIKLILMRSLYQEIFSYLATIPKPFDFLLEDSLEPTMDSLLFTTIELFLTDCYLWAYWFEGMW